MRRFIICYIFERNTSFPYTVKGQPPYSHVGPQGPDISSALIGLDVLKRVFSFVIYLCLIVGL